ncbi:MAG: hypothetical protein JWP31_761, partial [Aeromicrobium sp.]|nr:hypothetical protein [Aeromicrobium sp.]
FEQQTGGYGGFLGFGHEMADREATMHSHELVIRDVAPRFRGSNVRPQANFNRLSGMEMDWSAPITQAQAVATASWEEAKAAKAVPVP